MRQFIILAGILLCSTSVFSQFGINARSNWNDAPQWMIDGTSGSSEIELLGDGLAFGVDYWFRLKNVRVEFLPELNYASYESELNGDLSLSVNTYSLFWNTNFYLFDFEGDCDCPTFSKQGPSLQKGFFLQVSPGISYFNFDSQVQDNQNSSSDLAFSIGGAVGIDFGVSDLITITPMLGLRYYPSVLWEDLEGISTTAGTFNGENTSDITQFFAGIRFGVRLDDGY